VYVKGERQAVLGVLQHDEAALMGGAKIEFSNL
jgi:hypothetical protein